MIKNKEGLKTIGQPSTTAVKKCKFMSVCATGDTASDHGAEQGRARTGAVQNPRRRRRLAQGDWVSEEAKAGDRAIVPDVTVVLRQRGSWPCAVPEDTENGHKSSPETHRYGRCVETRRGFLLL